MTASVPADVISRLKAVLAAGLVAAADLLLFDHEIGANLGLLMLAAARGANKCRRTQ